MQSNLRNPTGRLLKLASLALVLGACASGAARRTEAPAATSRLYGIAGTHLVRIDPEGGTATVVASSPELAYVGALTYDPGLDAFYAVAAAPGGPWLIAIERATGEVIAIGRIDLPSTALEIAEGLAFDPVHGRLYAAAGKSDFASNRLLELDVATGGATELGPIRGTAQDDVDAMALAGKVLYAIDTAANSSALYRLDLVNGEAAATGTSFRGAVTSLAYDAAGRRLIAAAAGSRQLLVIPLDGGETSTLGPIRDTAELGGAALTALAFADPTAAPLADNFESGDFSAWSEHQSGGDRPDHR